MPNGAMLWINGEAFSMASDKETPFDTLTVREAMNRVGLQIFTGQWNGKEYFDHWKLGLSPWPPTKLRGMEAVRELLRLVWDRTVIVERKIQDDLYHPIHPDEVLHFHGPSSSVAGEEEIYRPCRLRFPKTESKPMASNGGRIGYDYPPIVVRILRYMDEHGVGASIEQVTFAVIAQIEKEGAKPPSHSKIQPYVSALRAYRCALDQKFPELIPGTEPCD